MIAQKHLVLLVGARYYHGFNHATQGQGTKAKDADFNYSTTNLMTYDYNFPNRNVSLFAENIIHLHDKLSITPGIRYEYINTTADGYYGSFVRDLTGTIRNYREKKEYRNKPRQFLLGGVGMSYKPIKNLNAYANVSQNYRSITFSDMRISNPSSDVDTNMTDEKGYSIDIGVRSENTKYISYDVSLFYLNYNNRIGEILTEKANKDIRIRTNIGQAVMMGIEAYVESDILKIVNPKAKDWSGVIFGNLAFINSEYTNTISKIKSIKGNQVEFVPKANIKTGIKLAYKKLKGSFQYTYLSDQFSDATNAPDGGFSGVVGLIPAYAIMDLSLSYEFRIFKIEGSINNFANKMYFTRRATGYPGPGILPSDGRSFYLTLQVKI
jgi:Fe(3+) dicitrate transport protein